MKGRQAGAVKGMFRRGATWWLRYTPVPGGRQVRESLGTDVESVAAALAVRRLAMAPLEYSGEWAEEVERYLEDEVKAGNLRLRTTVPVRRAVLMAFSRDVGTTKPSLLSREVVVRWTGMLKEGGGGKGVGIAPDTVKSYVMYLRAFAGWLVKRGKLRENCVEKVELGKVMRSARKGFVPADVVRRLIFESPSDDLRFVLFCGFHAGMRKLEIVESVPGWFHLEPESAGRRGRISVEKTATFEAKDKDERTIPLTGDFEAFLRGYLGKLPSGARWVLQPEKEHGKHRYRWDFRRPFDDYLAAQGVVCSPHDMRRSFVSNALIADSSLIFKLAKWTGDGVEVLQRHYGHLLADDDDIEAGR